MVNIVSGGELFFPLCACAERSIRLLRVRRLPPRAPCVHRREGAPVFSRLARLRTAVTVGRRADDRRFETKEADEGEGGYLTAFFRRVGAGAISGAFTKMAGLNS